MLFDIIIVVVLLAVAVSHFILLSRMKEDEDTDEIWLGINVAIKDLEARLQGIEDTIKSRIQGLDTRLEVQNRVTGDLGRQMIYLEDDLMQKFEEFSEESIARREMFEKHLMEELSEAYKKHAKSLKKLSDDTWSAFSTTDKRLKEASKAHGELKRSLNGFKAQYQKRVDKFQALMDANTEAFEKANKDLSLRINDLVKTFESSKKAFDKDVKKSNTQIERVAKKLATQSQSLQAKITANAERNKKMVTDTKSRLQKTVSDNHARLEKKSVQQAEKFDSRLKKVSDEIEQKAVRVESRLEQIAKEIDGELSALVKSDEDLISNQELSGERIHSIQNDLVGIKENEDSFIRHVQRQNQITKNIENLVNRSNTFNYNTFQVFDRRFVRKDYEETLRPMLDIFGLSMSFNTMGYLAHKICKIEEDCVGRLATNIQDALIRLISVFGLKNEKCKILEIGTLFGINLCIVEELGAAYGKQLSYQIIDPLDGYYKKGQLDIVTKQEVNSRNFWYNLNKCGLQTEKFELIKGFSHHKRIIKQVKKRSIDLIFVDGDHTRKGVALDIRNYWQTLKKGGYFLFDDYGSREWPEVKEAVDASRIIKQHFRFVGFAFRTAIYAKK